MSTSNVNESKGMSAEELSKFYEIHDVKNCEIDETTGQIISYELCKPLVNSYGKGCKTYVFKDTKTIMLVSEDSPPNIIELLPFDQLSRILTDEQLDEMFLGADNV